MKITNVGNVGVGTTSPTRKLDIVGDLTTDAVRIKNTNANGGGLSVFAANGGGGSNRILTLGDSNENVKVAVLENGNLGIGTSSPGEKLEVEGGDIKIKDASAGLILTSPNGTVYKITVANDGTVTSTAV